MNHASSSSSSSYPVDNSWSVEWQWQTDNFLWRSFDAAISNTIESAYLQGEGSVEFTISKASRPTHFIIFQTRNLTQVNLATQKERLVRRQSSDLTSKVAWQWWDESNNAWKNYDMNLNTQFESEWKTSTYSQMNENTNCHAGVLFYIGTNQYLMQFEANGLQYDMRTASSCRSIRRKIYNLNQLPSSVSNVQDLVGPSRKHDTCQFDSSIMVDICIVDSDDNCPICLDGLENDTSVKLNKCSHIFHRECITKWFTKRPSCPQCSTVYGMITGTQPPGHMSIRYIPAKSYEAYNGLQGYPGIDIIEITYIFPNGIQAQEHPSPGTPYFGTQRVAYLPRIKEGEEVLELLKTGWKRRLIFTVGTSVTTGRSNCVVRHKSIKIKESHMPTDHHHHLSLIDIRRHKNIKIKGSHMSADHHHHLSLIPTI